MARLTKHQKLLSGLKALGYTHLRETPKQLVFDRYPQVRPDRLRYLFLSKRGPTIRLSDLDRFEGSMAASPAFYERVLAAHEKATREV